MPVVLTRPQAQAQQWAERLQQRGIAATVLPLQAIGPAPDPAALQRAAAGADGYAAVMFVSVNAAQAFLAAAPVFERARAWAPGPGTREALLSAGVPAARISAPAADAAQFDSEHLWLQVRGQLAAGDRLLLVRGADSAGSAQGRDWLARQLAAAGVQVETIAAYARRPATWSHGQQAAARQAAADGSLWLFSSSEALRQLPVLLPGQDWSQARALVTHPRIAEAAGALGFGRVITSRPSFDEVLASIESDR